MNAFDVSLLPEAIEDLRNLDPAIAQRVRRKLEWLGVHAAEVQHIPLSGRLSGLFKRYVGAYRIIYELDEEGRTLVVHAVGHRKDIYGP